MCGNMVDIQSAAAEIRRGKKEVWGLSLFGEGELGPHLTLSLGPRPISLPSGILIHPPFGGNRYGPKMGAVPLWVS